MSGQTLEVVQHGGPDVCALTLARVPGQQQSGAVGGRMLMRPTASHSHFVDIA